MCKHKGWMEASNQGVALRTVASIPWCVHAIGFLHLKCSWCMSLKGKGRSWSREKRKKMDSQLEETKMDQVGELTVANCESLAKWGERVLIISVASHMDPTLESSTIFLGPASGCRHFPWQIYVTMHGWFSVEMSLQGINQLRLHHHHRAFVNGKSSQKQSVSGMLASLPYSPVHLDRVENHSWIMTRACFSVGR